MNKYSYETNILTKNKQTNTTNVLETIQKTLYIGATILGIGFLMPAFYLGWSLFFGKDAGSNPWGARGLEWEECTSPPIPHNFEKTPVVTHEAYAYTGEETVSV